MNKDARQLQLTFPRTPAPVGLTKMPDTQVFKGLTAPLLVKRSARARRMTLKVDSRDGTAILVLPRRASLDHGLDFVRSKAGWIESHVAQLTPRVPFVDGAWVPVRGKPLKIKTMEAEFPGISVSERAIYVAGDPEQVGRRVLHWLKEEARAEIVARAEYEAQRVNKKIRRITLRDPRTRWGSCSGRGDLAFSWRLILAPTFVRHYVIAHEVAHLVQPNHSAAFWKVVAKLMPGYEKARAWLTEHGHELHRYG